MTWLGCARLVLLSAGMFACGVLAAEWRQLVVTPLAPTFHKSASSPDGSVVLETLVDGMPGEYRMLTRVSVYGPWHDTDSDLWVGPEYRWKLECDKNFAVVTEPDGSGRLGDNATVFTISRETTRNESLDLSSVSVLSGPSGDDVIEPLLGKRIAVVGIAKTFKETTYVDSADWHVDLPEIRKWPSVTTGKAVVVEGVLSREWSEPSHRGPNIPAQRVGFIYRLSQVRWMLESER